MSTFARSRFLVLAALLTAGTMAMAQTPGPSPAPSPSESASPSSMPSSPDAMGMQRPGGPGQYAPGQYHPERDGRGMMGGNMSGNMSGMVGPERMPADRGRDDQMMGGPMRGGPMMMGGQMMGGCPFAGRLPPGNEKLAMRMHGEIMVAIGNILIENADNIQAPPAR